MDTLVALPQAQFRNGTEAVATLGCGHRIMIDGEFSINEHGRLYWEPGACGPSSVLFGCGSNCPWDTQRVVHVWRFSD